MQFQWRRMIACPYVCSILKSRGSSGGQSRYALSEGLRSIFHLNRVSLLITFWSSVDTKAIRTNGLQVRIRWLQAYHRYIWTNYNMV